MADKQFSGKLLSLKTDLVFPLDCRYFATFSFSSWISNFQFPLEYIACFSQPLISSSLSPWILQQKQLQKNSKSKKYLVFLLRPLPQNKCEIQKS